MDRSRLVRIVVPLTAIVTVAGAGAWALRPASTPAGATTRTVPASFRTFDGCPALLTYFRTNARPLVGPYGLGEPGVVGVPGYGVPMESRQAEAAPGAAAGAVPDAPSAQAPADAGATSASGTNVQVAGVDEADVSKRAGDLLLTVAGPHDGLTVIRTSGTTARVAGRLATTWHPDALLVQGTTVLLVGALPGGPVMEPLGPAVAGPARWPTVLRPVPPVTPRTRIAEVDIADPAHPRVVRTLDLDGVSAGARLHDGLLQLALTSAPSRLPFVQPAPRTGPIAPPNAGSGSAPVPSPATPGNEERQAQARNLAVLDRSTAQQWLPAYTLTAADGATRSGGVLDCSRVGVPDRFSGVNTLTLLTFDLRTAGIARWSGAGVVASGTTVYATPDRTYVATHAWGPVRPLPAAGTPWPLPEPVRPRTTSTQIHAFATGAGDVRYLGSGQVDGSLLGQYALDEYQGRLRVATTTGSTGEGFAEPMVAPGVAVATAPGARPPAAVAPSASAVTVLELRDGALRQVGRVGGLGRGETIHAVRFAGPLGYVVTFRQTDPLYTLDLADPTRPRVAGDLSLLGYSAYLHPLGGGLLLGVGQDASAQGMTRGVLVALFDVADPAHPRLLDRVTLPGGWAGTESDPHAFTYAAGLALVPVPTGVLAVPVRDRALGTPSLLGLQSGSAPADGMDPGSTRTFALGTTLWTVAGAAPAGVVAAHDVHGLDLLSSITF